MTERSESERADDLLQEVRDQIDEGLDECLPSSDIIGNVSRSINSALRRLVAQDHGGADAGVMELLPCPFCGDEPEIRKRMDEDIWTHNTVEWTGVHCAECGIGFEWPPGAEPDAKDQWNSRAALSKPAPVAANASVSDKTVINNWNGGGTLQTWTDGEWQILYAKDSAGNCVTLSLTSQDAIRLAYAVSSIPNEQFERLRAANEAVYELSYPEARSEELRQVADVIDCGGNCGRCGSQSLDRGEFCDFVAAENLRKLASALDLKAAISKPAPLAANTSAEARLREAHIEVLRGLIDVCDHPVNDTGPDKTTGPHLINLLDVIERTPSMPIDKIARWTGFIQGVLCARGAISVDAERDRTRPIFSPDPHASDCDKQGEPGLNWKLSDECKRQLAEIDDNIRNAAINAGNIIAGKRP